jgi:myosin-5
MTADALLMSEMSNQHHNPYSSHEKTYVWVKLRSDGTSCISPTQGGNSPTKNGHRRQRTTSASTTINNDLDDLWKWTPGYFSCSSQPATTPSPPTADLSSSAPSSSATLVEYHFTLMEQRTSDLNYELHTLPENIASKYLESGDIVLANSWEIHDFMHRFENEDYDGNDSMDVADRNPSQPPHNLIELTHLHEPSVVNALRHRYYQRTREQSHDIHNVYTDTGSILLAVNPFQIANDDDEEEGGDNVGNRSLSSNRLSLYGENTMHQYKLDGEKRWINEMIRIEHGGDDTSDDTNNSSSSSSTLPPHVYAVADRTFRTMITRVHHKSTASGYDAAYNRATSTVSSAGKRRESVDADNEKVNQSILVSGESGAGKTVTTKLLMTYLSKLSNGGAFAGSDGDDSLLCTSSSSVQKINTSSSSSSSSSSSPNDIGMSIEKRILESNPILESFGNARTVRNDNSSRFGKYIEMKFLSSLPSSSSSSGINLPVASLVGASIETYLLEKVRLVHQSSGERNYHIFYELFSMKYAEEDDDYGIVKGTDNEGGVVSFNDLGLLDYDMEDFRMLNNSGAYDRRDGVPDQQTFWNTKHAMTAMGFTPCDLSNVLQVIASLLHAANLTFVQKDVSTGRIVGDECALDETNPHLGYVVNLLGISVDNLNSAVCYHEITIGGDGGGANGLGRVHHNRGGTSETHQRVLTQEQAAKGVEALIKATYGAVFEYLVRRINSSVASGNASSPNQLAAERSRAGRGRLVKESSIGILVRVVASPTIEVLLRSLSINLILTPHIAIIQDIFGFESFQTNSFEQLCINYCNEALQQQFNRFVLKREQEEYDREGIPWSFIEFPENQDVLDLLDSKGLGIFNVLHDQCRMPRASDKSFAHCMYEKCSNHTRFEADSRQRAEQMFAVHHYAGVVEYDVDGFVEKNRDELPKNGLNLMLSSTNGFVRTLAQILVPRSSIISSPLSPSSKGGKQTSGTQRPTVGVQFSSQLHDLRRKIDSTSPHYIRCLKPNTLFTPHHFDEALVSNQLRCAGVIEAVQVSRLGYPHRFSHSQFVARYHMLGGKSINLNKKNSAGKNRF